MSNRFLRAVLALYPRGFRRRYGPEVQGLVNDLEAAGDRSRLRLLSGLLVSAVAERLRTVRLDARLTIPTLVAVAALGTIVGAAGPAATPATALPGPMAPPPTGTSSAAGPAATPATALPGPMAPPPTGTSSAAGPAAPPATALPGPMAPAPGGHVERHEQTVAVRQSSTLVSHCEHPPSGLALSALTRRRNRWIRRAIRKPADEQSTRYDPGVVQERRSAAKEAVRAGADGRPSRLLPDSTSRDVAGVMPVR